MKKHLVSLILIAGLAFFSWGAAQGTRTDLFDLKKMQQELEILKGILSTTLTFFAKDYAAREAPAKTARNEFSRESWRFSNINAFYLYGQGATFVVPMSGLRLASIREDRLFASLTDLEHEHAQVEFNAQEALRAAQLGLEEAQRDLQKALAEQRFATPAPSPAAIPQPPPPPQAAPPAPPAPPERVLEKQEEVRKKLADAQAKVRKRREEAEQTRQKLLAAVAAAKVHLAEALANHADSLTQVKPNEYINLVIVGDERAYGLLGVGGSSSGAGILSVQKSVITDYKAGKITLDAFKQKVLQYSN